jgi:hypothetical protein
VLVAALPRKFFHAFARSSASVLALVGAGLDGGGLKFVNREGPDLRSLSASKAE